MKPPGYHRDWHVAVRVASTKKLVAFVSGIPVTVRVREKYVNFSNYLWSGHFIDSAL